jgi:PAS domain S-box-containing protein
MHDTTPFRKQFFVRTVLFVSTFTLLSWGYLHRHNQKNSEQFARHVAIITNDLWALNRSAVESYLQLAVQADDYNYLRVRLENNTPFLTVNAPPLSGIDQFLYAAGLIPLEQFSTPINYDGKIIGFLEGEQYQKIIYPLLNIFGFLLLLTFATLYVVNLRTNRRVLAEKVQERTRKYRDSEQRFHDLINLLPEIVCETDVQGRLTYVNKIALKRFGLSGTEIQSTTCFDLIIDTQQERARKNFALFLQGQELELQEFTARSTDGQTFPVLIRSAPIYDGLEVRGVRSIIIDITERFSLEEKLRSAQRMEVIGLMASGVAHDLNNILSGIINYPEIILNKLPPDDPLRSPVTAIKNSGLRAAEVVTDLLTVARGAAATKVVINPNDLIREYLESPEFLQLKERFQKIRWKTELDRDVANIFCSPIHVKKCLMNLFINGAEAIGDRGEILLTTQRREDKEENSKNRTWTIIKISDTGPGIARKDLNHIFEPFYTRKVMGKSGTGLGLTVVWNTLRDHDGEVRVRSDDNGTTFTLCFPGTDQNPSPLPKTADAQIPAGSGEKILVIDDDPQQRDIAIQLLSSLGYRVAAASSGEDAVEYLRTRAVHLLLLDMLMPPGMNGLQTYKRILAIHPRQKAVLASGFSASREVKEALETGASAFIKKPYVMEQLGRTVYSALH